MNKLFSTANLKVAFLLIFAFRVSISYGEAIYSKTFGDPLNKAIIFLHGGPGYNCANFEVTAAQKLADEGFFVIVYDRRGEGRSRDAAAKYTYQETIDDINSLYQEYNLKSATLIGHSFGGIVATLFAEVHAEKIRSIVLVGAPVSLQATFKNVIERSKAIYESRSDSINLKYISMLEKMDTSSLEYSSYCFMHAMQNGFYTPADPGKEAKEIYFKFRVDSVLQKYASKMDYEAPKGFWESERYTTLDLKTKLEKLTKNGTKIFAMYGKEDGLFSAKQVSDLEKLLGTTNLKYIDNCSHNVFIDQRQEFLNQMKVWGQ